MPRYSQPLDLDEVWDRVAFRDLNWLLAYTKLHDINQCTDEYGNTVLHHAAYSPTTNIVDFLSNFLIDPNIKNSAGQTALQLARNLNERNLYILQHAHLCIDFDEALDEPTGLNALLAAIYRGDEVLEDFPGVKDDGNELNEGGWSALQCAAMYNRPELIHQLSQRFPNLNPNYSSHFNSPALRIAAMFDHPDCIIALYECFPSINVGDALQTACEYNSPGCIPALSMCFPHLTGNEFRGNRNHSALMYATSCNNHECIRALHACFPLINPNLRDVNGRTALISAVRYLEEEDDESDGIEEEEEEENNDEDEDDDDDAILQRHMRKFTHPVRNARLEKANCIPVLAECFPDLDPNIRDMEGNTALMCAIEQGWSNSVTLLASGFPSTDANLHDFRGGTALMMAVGNKDIKCLIALYQSFPNLDPNVRDFDGNSALLCAAWSENPEPIIAQLHALFPNIDPNIQDNMGHTALILAACKCNPDPMLAQLQKFYPNINPNLQSYQNQDTALMYLLKSPHCTVDSIRFFIKTFPNIDANIKNKQSHTALMLIIRIKHYRVLWPLLGHLAQID